MFACSADNEERIEAGSVEVRSIVDVDFSLWSSSGVMCVLQPAKTAELRQPGIFAHAVKTGGMLSIPWL